jgi:long-chain acyl-CoA synthetase
MLFEALFQHARENPQDIAITDDQGHYTWQQLAAMASGLGMYIASQTSRPHVGLLLPPGAGYVASFYATLLAGKSVVPINYLLGDRDIAHVIRDSGISTVITAPPLAARLKDESLKLIDLTQLPTTPPAVIPPKLPAPGADDMAVLMYTSGTSGEPKGVMLTYGNLFSDTQACIQHAGLQSRHVFLGIIPLFHSFGMTASMIAPVTLGAHMVYIARFSPVATLAAIRQQGISIMFGVPSMFGALLRMEDPTREDFARMYAMISGGEPLPGLLREGFENRFGATIYEGYGLTETSPVIALNTPASARHGSVGRPIPGVEVKIVDDEGTPVPAGESGEVWLRGPMVMKGYYNRPEETAAALTADRFFKTGDLGRVDEDGFLYITGRKKDLIICAGEKVVPREVEDMLRRHPAVAEVAVVGRKDPTRGEAVVAFVVAQKDVAVNPEELRIFCRDQGLVPWKCPREVMFIDEMPRSPTGKILKRVLCEQLNQA